MNLGGPVLKGCALDVVSNLAVAQSVFESDELALLESLREFREIAPGIDEVPFGAGFVIAFVVLPAFLSRDVEYNELAVVLSGLASAF